MTTLSESDPRLKQKQLITVGVFSNDDGSSGYRAYTTWYSPEWPGCCEHQIEALNGIEAKKIAISEHKAQCLKTRDDALKKEIWEGQSKIHAETADEYAERSHEVCEDLSEAYSNLSEAHRQLSKILRVKAGLPRDPRNND